MIRMILIIIGWFLGVNLNGQNLESHIWKNRVVIIKANDSSLNKYNKQLREFENSTEELKDRKVVLYQIIGSSYKFKGYKKGDQMETGKVSLRLIEEVLNEKNDFEIILVGLDGGVKLRKKELLTKEELFGKIDLMPMRRAELRNRSKEN